MAVIKVTPKQTTQRLKIHVPGQDCAEAGEPIITGPDKIEVDGGPYTLSVAGGTPPYTWYMLSCPYDETEYLLYSEIADYERQFIPQTDCISVTALVIDACNNYAVWALEII